MSQLSIDSLYYCMAHITDVDDGLKIVFIDRFKSNEEVLENDVEFNFSWSEGKIPIENSTIYLVAIDITNLNSIIYPVAISEAVIEIYKSETLGYPHLRPYPKAKITTEEKLLLLNF